MQNTKPYLLNSKRTDIASLECDCAPVRYIAPRKLPLRFSDTPLVQSSLYLKELPQAHALMFNPFMDDGVVVANSAAYDIWRTFESPRRVNSLPKQTNYGIENLSHQMYHLGLLQQAATKKITPIKQRQALTVWLHIINDCNLSCSYCYVSKSAAQMPLQIGYASVDAAIRSAVSGEFSGLVLKYAGGEASLNLDLVYALDDYASNRCAESGLNLESVLLSNGVILDDNAIDVLKARNFRLMISLDGIHAVHDIHRKLLDGSGSFESVERTLDRLQGKDFAPFIAVTVTNQNAKGLTDTVKYLLDRELRFNLSFYRDNACVSSLENLNIHNGQLITHILNAFKVIENQLPESSLLGVIDRTKLNSMHDKTCGAGDSYLAINHLGQIAKCHMELDQPITSIHVDDPLSEIQLDQKHFQNLTVDEKEGCHHCDWRYWCAGGCPLVTHQAAGRADTRSPYCSVYKAVYPELLRLEGLRLMKYSGIPIAM